MYARCKMLTNLRKSRPIQTKKPAFGSGRLAATNKGGKLFENN